MKKYIYQTVLAFAVIALSSCSDFLNQTPPDQETSDTFWRSTEAAEAGLATAYSQLESSNMPYGFGEVRYTVEPYREDMISAGPDAVNYSQWLQLAEFTYDYSNTQLSIYWEDAYRGAMQCNQVIEKVAGIEKMDKEYRAQIIDEATFLRAYYHFKLLMNWERIIIKDKYQAVVGKLDKGVSSRTEAWDFIINDLIKLTTDSKLPLKQPEGRVGRVTKGTAYAYLGYSYLTRAYEEPAKKSEYLKKAEEAFKEVKGYKLVEKTLSMFDGTNKNSEESIFELQFTDNTAGGAYYRHYLHKFVGCSQLGGWGGIRPSARLLQEFKKEGKIASTGRYDTRAYATLFFEDDYYFDPSTGMVYGYPFDEVFIPESDPSKPKINYLEFRKYLPSTEENLYRSNSAINVPLMRYADVMLMLAEALNEQGKSADAIPLINDIRKRSDMPAMTGTSQDEVKAQIEHERIVEFALENSRFYDLRRWGKTEQALHAVGRTSFVGGKHNFYPIPQREINSNSVLREQLAQEKK